MRYLREKSLTDFKQDLVAMGLPPRWKMRYKVTNRIAFFVYLLRICEQQKCTLRGVSRLRYFVNRFRLDRLGERLGFDIPLYVFGPGLSIAHRGSIVVNGDARVGARCRIHPGVVIGAIEGKSPVVGDDVFIGPNAGLFGAVTVGHGAKIGPLAMVRSNVPEGARVVAADGQLRP